MKNIMLQSQGRKFTVDQWVDRLKHLPEKMELIDGNLYWNEEERLGMLAMLLENVGVDKAVRIGDAQVWRDAIAKLDDGTDIE